MRIIEKMMNRAILNSENWSKDNTRVEYDAQNEISRVYLHGNLIAEIGECFVTLYDGGWQTPTTKSRINAILAEHGVPGEYVFQQNFQWFVRTVQGVKVSDKEGFRTVPFVSGMVLS